MSVSTGVPYILSVSSGGYLFFLKFFVESNREELSKTGNNLLPAVGQTPYNYGLGLRPNITIGLFQNGQTGGGAGRGWGIVFCLLSLI